MGNQERISYLKDIPFNNAEWISEREEACNSVLYMYSCISEKFRTDSKFGDKFVQENQKLIGELVCAASNLLKNKK